MTKQVTDVCVGVLATTLALALTSPAHSQDARDPNESVDDSRARELYLRGDRLYSEGNYEESAADFEEAYRLTGRPVLLYNLANVYERLGRLADAVRVLRDYMPHAPETQRDSIRRRVNALERRVSQRLGEEKNQKKQDQAVPAPASPQPTTPAPAPAPPPQPGPPVFGYVLLGVGALGVGLGTYFAFHAAGARGDAEKLCPESNGSRWCTVQAKDSLDQDQRSSLLADISFGLGAASAMTGLVLVLTSGSSKKETEDALRLQATPVAGGGEVDLVGRF